MITREADYAIRAVLYLSDQDSSRLVATSELAKEMLVPYRFLRRIVQKLVENGLLEAQRGKGGGVRLSRPGKEITVFEVLRMVDPKSVALSSCLNGRTDCPRSQACTIRRHLGGLQEKIDDELQGLTFDQLGGETITTSSQ